MCVNCGCDGVTLLAGNDGIGIVSITDNENGTFTILMSDGSSFISPDYTGPQGDQGPAGDDGINGINGTTLLYTQVNKQFSVEDPPLDIVIDTTLLSTDGDTLRLQFVYHSNNATGSFNIVNIPSTGSNEDVYIIPISKERTGIIQVILIKDGTSLKGYAFSSENLNVDILIENFFNGTTSTFNIEADLPVADGWFNNITLELLKFGN